MKIKNSMKMIALSVVASTLFVGCGSSSDDAVTQVTPPLTGTFVDAPVQGLDYQTPTQSGVTDKDGHFKYKAGEDVEFKLGNLSLGKGTGSPFVTPYDLAENNDTVATNIALVLQNCDNDRTDTILNVDKLKDFNFSDFDLSKSNADLETKLTTLLASADFQTVRGGTAFGLLNTTTVKTAMDSYIQDNSVKYDKKFTQSFLDTHDFYVTDVEYGSQIQRFNNGELYYAGDSYTDDNGVFVQGAGFDGIFNIDGSGVATYTIDNGIVSIAYDGGSFIVTTKILNISDNFIEVFQQASNGKTRTVKWYTDKQAAQENYYKNALNKKGVPYSLSTQFGYKEFGHDVTFSQFTDTSFELTLSNGTTSKILKMPYTVTDGILVVDWSSVGDSIDYTKILTVNSDEITFCSENTLEKAKVCTKPAISMVLSNANDFITQKNSSSSIMKGTLITSLTQIQNIPLYRLEGYHGASGNIDYLSQTAIMITDSKKINRYFYWQLDASSDAIDHPETASYNYDVNFANNILTINGTDVDGDTENRSNSIYKYSLIGQTFTAKELASNLMFDTETITNVLDDNTSFTFTKGNTYCTVLWGDCWIDKDAMDSLKSQLTTTSKQH